jgi:drug/metabolite transporter (DMT)-like permease
MSRTEWLLLLALSVLWGGSFFFVGVAVKELPAFTIVLARVALAAFFLLPLVLAAGLRLPATLTEWMSFVVMSVLNNVLPFTFITFGQKAVPSGLASVLNATTPLFALVIMHLFADEKLQARKLLGVALGILGVAVLIGWTRLDTSVASPIGMLLCLAGSLSYGFAALWGRRLRTTPPLVAATCQLLASTAILALLAALVEQPWMLPSPTAPTLLALGGLAALSTSLAYVIFYRILSVSGPTNVMLVTLLIPVTGIGLGVTVLGETLEPRHIMGALVIASGLLVIDGRILSLLPSRTRTASDQKRV